MAAKPAQPSSACAKVPNSLSTVSNQMRTTVAATAASALQQRASTRSAGKVTNKGGGGRIVAWGGCHGRADRGHARLKTRLPLVPPKPKLFFNA